MCINKPWAVIKTLRKNINDAVDILSTEAAITLNQNFQLLTTVGVQIE